MKLHKLVVTGGHPTPALAVIDEIQKNHPGLNITFVGRRFVNSRERANSLEYQEVVARKVNFIHTHAKRGGRGTVELPYRTLECISVLQKEKPDAVLSFGGYIGVPIVLAAYFLKIPVFLHEQTIRPGTANLRLARLATKVMVSFPQTIDYFGRNKTVVTGNPLRSALFHTTTSSKFSHIQKPVILVQGGNLGSHSVNMHIFTILPQLVEKYSIIHQVGNVKQYGDWESAQETHLSLSNELKHKYFPVQHLSTPEMAEAYARADLVVARSGASTVSELIALHKPAVLIPLPWSAHGEQMAHAKLLAGAKVAVIFDQAKPSNELFSSIQHVADNVQSYIDHYETFAQVHDPQAAEKILHTIRETLAKTQ